MSSFIKYIPITYLHCDFCIYEYTSTRYIPELAETLTIVFAKLFIVHNISCGFRNTYTIINCDKKLLIYSYTRSPFTDWHFQG